MFRHAMLTTIVVGMAAVAGGGGSLPAASAAEVSEQRLVIGAKKFTESALLAELMAQLLERDLGVVVERRFNLGGTEIAYGALVRGEIDLYAEYTGTALRAVLHDERKLGAAATLALVSRRLARRDKVAVLAPFGFDNSYALMMRADRARALRVTRLSDLRGHPLRYGVSHEFARRVDGLPGLTAAYGLHPAGVVHMEHDLVYQALADRVIDVADAYTTDAHLADGGLVALPDDRGFFPPYEAAPFVRQELLRRMPQVAGALALLAGRIDDVLMRRLNAQVELEHRSVKAVAARVLGDLGLVRHQQTSPPPRRSGLFSLLWQRRWRTLQLAAQHLLLTGVAVLAACCFGIPLALAVSRRRRAATLTIGAAGILQTIPSIALLAFMLPLFGIGARPAIVALFLYGLLPIVRNTIAGLRSVDSHLLEVALGLGMTRAQRLWRVELPLAVPVILAGVRTAAVINVGTATLAAFIGAGGLGEPIVTGLTMSDFDLVLSGALPAALLALLIDGLLGGLERLATPRGMRLAVSRPV